MLDNVAGALDLEGVFFKFCMEGCITVILILLMREQRLKEFLSSEVIQSIVGRIRILSFMFFGFYGSDFFQLISSSLRLTLIYMPHFLASH